MGKWGDITGGLGDAATKGLDYIKGANRGNAAEAGPYGGIDQANFGLPGAEGRESQYQSLIQGLQGMQTPMTGAPSWDRGQQRNNIAMLQAQARGEGPSMAGQAAEQGAQRAVSQQQAMLAGGRGNPAAQARAAAQQAGAAQGSIAGNAAMGRAQEQLGAQQQLTGALAGLRGQEQQLNLANQNAQMGMNQLQTQGTSDLMGQSLRQAGMQQQGGMGYEQNRTNRFGSMLGTPTENEQMLGMIQGGLTAAFGI